jgi:Glycosyltransferase family 87
VGLPERVPAFGARGSASILPKLAALAAVLFLLACSLARGGFFSSADPGDVGRYHEFADRILDGELPYRDFYMEYPPGAVPTFLAPTSLGGDYNLSFKLTVAAAGLGVVAAVVAALALLQADRRRTAVALGLLAVTPVALGAVVLNRYDLWPALLVSLAVVALLAERPRLGFGLLAAGCAVKIYPAVVLPVAAIHVLRTRGSRALVGAVAVFAVVLVLIAGPLAAIAPGGFGYSVKTQVVRQLHLESLGASLLLAADKLGLYAADIVPGRPGSIDLGGGLPDALGVLTTLVLVAALAAVVLVYWRAEESDELLAAGFAASVAAFVAFSKVISPQFLVWLVPLVPLVARRAGLVASGLLLAVLVTTQVEVVWEHPLRAGGWPVWVLLVRNLLLVALFVVLLGAVRGHARREPAPAPR